MNNNVRLGGLLRRAEAGAFLELLAVLVFFGIFGGLSFLKLAGLASWLNVAANLGVIAIPIGLLMISGELDISVGVMAPGGAMTVAIIAGHYGLSIWLGVVATLALGLLVGLINGLMVIRTAVSSLIVTLGSLFAIQGTVLAVSVFVTKASSVARATEGLAKTLFGDFIAGQMQIMFVWWVLLAICYVFFVHSTRYGNWIFAMGEDKVSARSAGIPREKMTVLLFVLSSTSAAFVGMCQASLYSRATSTWPNSKPQLKATWRRMRVIPRQSFEAVGYRRLGNGG